MNIEVIKWESLIELRSPDIEKGHGIRAYTFDFKMLEQNLPQTCNKLEGKTWGYHNQNIKEL